MLKHGIKYDHSLMHNDFTPYSFGFHSPRNIGQMWIDQFDWVYENMDYAVFGMTIHPDVSVCLQVLLMHQRIIEHINKHEGVRWVNFNQIADDFLKRCPRKK